MLRNIILFLCFTYSVIPSGYSQDRTSSPEEIINGVTLAMHSFDYDLDYGEKVDEIAALGAEWIQVNVKFYQENIYSSRIVSLEGYDGYWRQFEEILVRAKQNDLKVSILPIILLSQAQGSNWRGLIEPYDLEKWFRYYNKLVQRIALLAEKHEVEMLTVGSELVNLQQYVSHWENLIENVREVFSGKLNYAANWDAYAELQFLDKLDYLGISGYFDLTESTSPSAWSLRSSWNTIKKQILAFQKERNIPIIFTELGYTSQDGTNMHPWNYYASDVVDLEEQKACYKAFIDVWGSEKNFHGVMFYDWYAEGGPTDTGYTIRNKPAEKIVKDWFEQIRK